MALRYAPHFATTPGRHQLHSVFAITIILRLALSRMSRDWLKDPSHRLCYCHLKGCWQDSAKTRRDSFTPDCIQIKGTRSNAIIVNNEVCGLGVSNVPDSEQSCKKWPNLKAHHVSHVRRRNVRYNAFILFLLNSYLILHSATVNCKSLCHPLSGIYKLTIWQTLLQPMFKPAISLQICGE